MGSDLVNATLYKSTLYLLDDIYHKLHLLGTAERVQVGPLFAEIVVRVVVSGGLGALTFHCHVWSGFASCKPESATGGAQVRGSFTPATVHRRAERLFSPPLVPTHASTLVGRVSRLHPPASPGAASAGSIAPFRSDSNARLYICTSLTIRQTAAPYMIFCFEWFGQQASALSL
jgi:hypothetical protein